MTAADTLRALAAEPIELLGPPEGVELAAPISPERVLALADLVEAAEKHQVNCEPMVDWCYCRFCEEDWPCGTAKALARVEEAFRDRR